jgi:chemotaxis protein histidine kinase CheA
METAGIQAMISNNSIQHKINMKQIRWIVLILFFISSGWQAQTQNINGERILVGRESITVINFPDKVLNINFSDDAAYDYYIPKRREERSISLQFNKEQATGPNTGLLVNEGGRSHMFRIVFDSTYNINDDSRPPLWYDHSSLKELKAFVQKQKEMQSAGNDAASVAKQDREQEEERKKQIEARKAEAALAQKKSSEEAAEKARDAEKLRKSQEAKEKEEAALIAQTKKEAEEKEKQLQMALQKEETDKKARALQEKKDAEELAKKQAAEQQRLKELKAKNDAEALAKAEKAAEEQKLLREQETAKKHALEEEKRKQAAAEFARREAEKKAAQEKLAQLEADRKKREAERAYSEIGLWQRYGKKGIDVYNIPAGQMAMVNADFFIVADTLRNFRIADSLMKSSASEKINIAAGKIVNGGVKMTLENIAFKDVHTYYKVKIENETNEDFLLGKTYMYWYDKNEQAKMIIKGSYLTYISFYPIIRPRTSQYIVFVTRSPNVVEDESLVLFIDDRRKEKGGTSIVVPGKYYVSELAKVQSSVKATANKRQAETQVEEPESKSSKRNRKKK